MLPNGDQSVNRVPNTSSLLQNQLLPLSPARGISAVDIVRSTIGRERMAIPMVDRTALNRLEGAS
jgi:hypothetical protein